jgi:hypothetical protein
MKRIITVFLCSLLFTACASSGERVVKPKTHKIWPAGNRYVIDIPVGARHIRFIERKRTKKVRMK